MRKKVNEILKVATLTARNLQRLWWGLAESEFGRILESGDQFSYNNIKYGR
jgi:hypothetical protein